MRARTNLLDQRLRLRVIPFKSTRIVNHQIDPRRPAIPSRADKRLGVPGRRETHFKQRIWQVPLLVHRFIQADKFPAALKRLRVGDSKLEFLMKMIDSAIESLVTFHYEVGSALRTVSKRRQRRQQSGVGHEVSKPRGQPRVKRDCNEFS